MGSPFFTRLLLLFLALACSAQDSMAQSPAGTDTSVKAPAPPSVRPPVVRPVPVAKPKGPKPLRSELSFGARLVTDGWSIFGEKGVVRSDEGKKSDQFYNIRFYSVEFAEHKHQKEYKRSSDNASLGGDNVRPFIYGKINNFYALKLGYGYRRMIAGKPEPQTVSLHWVYAGGLSLGLLKPYYLDALAPASGGGGDVSRRNIKYSPETQQFFLREQYIFGGAAPTVGLGETKFIPGAHGRTALHFDFAPSKRHVLALETGVNVEAYSSKVQLMANQGDSPIFFNLFASLQFGWRK